MMTRLHTFLFGPLPLSRTPHFESTAFDAVKVDPAALQQWRTQLDAPGFIRSGLLVGNVDDGVLTVRYAVPTGYRSWRTAPLLGDTRYVLGYLDGLNAGLEQPLDWYGHWVTNADNSPPSAVDVEITLRHGQQRLLFSPDHLLLTVGEQDGRVVVEAYRPVGGAIEALPVLLPGEES